MRAVNCAGALQYVPELTWLLFLRILDENEIAGRRSVRRPCVAEFRARARGALPMAGLGVAGQRGEANRSSSAGRSGSVLRLRQWGAASAI
ncbi:MAG: hypothetical protein MZV65_42275 [Chromatiales bacterium]|nr:hypothetical protein [Chromatiales bacterium]